MLQTSSDLLTPSPVSGTTALIVAVRGGHIETTRLLLSIDSIDPNGIEVGRDTALIIAASEGNPELIALLIPATRASLNHGTKGGNTALMMAANYNRNAAVHLLLGAAGINTEIKNKDGKTALMIAEKKGFKKIVYLFQMHKNRMRNLPPPVQGGIIYRLFSRISSAWRGSASR